MISPSVGAKSNWEMLGQVRLNHLLSAVLWSTFFPLAKLRRLFIDNSSVGSFKNASIQTCNDLSLYRCKIKLGDVRLGQAEALAVIVFHSQLSFHLPNRVASSLIIVALGPLRTLQFRPLMISPSVGAKSNWEMLGQVRLNHLLSAVLWSTFFPLAKLRRLFIDNSSVGSFKNASIQTCNDLSLYRCKIKLGDVRLGQAEALAVIVFHSQLSFHLPNRVASSLIIVSLGSLRTLQFRRLMISPSVGAKLNWEMLGQVRLKHLLSACFMVNFLFTYQIALPLY